MLPISVPNLLDHIFIGFQLVAHVPRVPILATIVKAEVKPHPVLVRQGEEQFDQVHGRHVTAFAKQVFRGPGYEFPVAGAYHYHRVYPYRLHIPEVSVPFLDAPVLMWNVM